MKRILAKGFAAVSILLSQNGMATILPPNNLHLEDNMQLDSNVTEAQFNALISQVEKYYAPIVASHGGKLEFNRLWSDTTVNASAVQMGSKWLVNMYGGLARRPEITPDGFTMVICHELGHHLAGFPYASSWAANEGQADYFAAQSCVRNLWKNDKAKNEMARESIPASAKSDCDDVWQTEAEQDICYRSMMAGRSLAELLAAGKKVSFEAHDTAKVKKTYNNHPEGQCRLDTFMAGSVCTADFDPKVIPRNEEETANYTCTSSAQYQAGTRPLCWFKPGT